MSDRSDGWIGHSLGLERLVELRGPESFRTLPDQAIFERSRAGIIIAAIVLHRPIVLSQTRWKTIPWQDAPQSKQPFQYVIDILADCPQLFVLKDKLYVASLAEERNILVQELEQQTQSLMIQLEAWKASYDIVEPNHSFEAPSQRALLP